MIGRAVLLVLCVALWAAGALAQIGPSGGGAGGVTGSFTAGDLLVANSSGQITDGSTVNPAILPTKLEINVGSFTPNSTLPTPSSLGLYITESVTGTCTASAINCFYNYLLINSDSLVVGSGSSGTFVSGVGWYFNHNIGGASMTGNRITADFNLLMNATTGNTALGASYGAVTISGKALANDNGTGTGAGTSRGQMESLNVVAELITAATNWNALQAVEIDVKVDGSSSVYEKVGLQIVQLANDATQGATYDTAIGIANQVSAVGWNTGILFGGLQGHWPFASGATAIKCDGSCGTLATVLDFSSATISSNFLSGPGFTVSGTGAVTALTYTPTSTTPPTNGMYLQSANELGFAANGTNTLFVAGGFVGVNATGVINTNDKLAMTSNANAVTSATFKNGSNGASAASAVFIGNDADGAKVTMQVNGSGNSGGNGANSFTVTSKNSMFLVGGTSTGIGINTSGGVQIGSSTLLTLAQGEVGLPKITASGSAPGAAGLKFEAVCGTNAGTAKIITYAGTSTTPVTVVDNVGSGVTGC